MQKRAGYDPSSAAIFAPYTATLYDYLHNESKYQTRCPLRGNHKQSSAPGITNGLQTAMPIPSVRTERSNDKEYSYEEYLSPPVILILATPFLGSEYTFDHLGTRA